MDDREEPSLFAQQVMSEIVAGMRVVLSERERVEGLTEYERLVIAKAAAKNGYTVWIDPDTQATALEPPALTPQPQP